MKDLPRLYKFILAALGLITLIIDLIGLKSTPLMGIAILVGVCIVALMIIYLERKNISGIVSFYSKRSSLPSTWWEKFYNENKNPKEIIMMGQSIIKAFTNPKQAKAFIKWCNQGSKVRILFLSPSNTELDQLQIVGKGMLRTFDDDPNENLRKKIYESISSLDEFVISKIPAIDKKPMVRYATIDLPFSLMAVDEEMVVTLYGSAAEGDEQPTFLVKSKDSESYKSFMVEFERIWSDYSKVYPYEDLVVADYTKTWQKYIGLRDYALKLPPPQQAIIFPTYHCSEQCSYCMFRESRLDGPPEEMKPELLEKTLAELARLGVENYEISGGGEPLEHSQIEDVLSILSTFRSKHKNIKLGLLTNGLHLKNYDPARLLDIFNDYIRASRYERIQGAGKEREIAIWKEGIKCLLSVKRRDPSIRTKVGLKYLLTSSNTDHFVEIVKADLSDNDLSNVDHVRFRAERKVDKETITTIEQQIYYMIKYAHLTISPEVISLALSNFVYPRNFRCWISPMSVVIAPDGGVYVCCNYMYDKNRKCIGNISTNRFSRIWNSPRHQEIRRNIRRINCDRDEYCNCRYAEIQDKYEHIALTAGF